LQMRNNWVEARALEVGFDPNVWFNNVEVAAKKIGRETVQYVTDIRKYNIAYRLIVDELQRKREVRKKENTNSIENPLIALQKK